MKPIIALTMRQDEVPSRNECRDAIDQQWLALISQCGFVPLLLPNRVETALELIEGCQPTGYLFTGGNSLEKYSGNAPQRDKLEKLLIERAIAEQRPILGVCRGMQVIQDYWQTPLIRVDGHVASQQEILFRNERVLVNSFHDYGSDQHSDEFDVIGMSDDKVIKSIAHKKHRILGIMWHPERISPFRQQDIKLIREHFLQ